MLVVERPLENAPVYVSLSHLLEETSPTEEQVASLDPSVFAHPIRRDILFLASNTSSPRDHDYDKSKTKSTSKRHEITED